ncbi:MAG: hypothetical protein ACTSQY_00380 [Candidatus Odinarchaeia archaeon]|nr:MAG: hypothetical protein [Lokiarchaeota virus Fenrir Meg22_1012]URC17257.1 MAG: hypothetical protein [Lokiarchaeota virus Fenrir Meg22_1214]
MVNLKELIKEKNELARKIIVLSVELEEIENKENEEIKRLKSIIRKKNEEIERLKRGG